MKLTRFKMAVMVNQPYKHKNAYNIKFSYWATVWCVCSWVIPSMTLTCTQNMQYQNLTHKAVAYIPWKQKMLVSLDSLTQIDYWAPIRIFINITFAYFECGIKKMSGNQQRREWENIKNIIFIFYSLFVCFTGIFLTVFLLFFPILHIFLQTISKVKHV